jgi:type IX secretion system PorP/SprF family membrane protein
LGNYSKMKERLTLLIVLLLCSAAYAQDPVFSQYYNSEVYLNPAMIGEEADLYLNYSYRSQWSNLDYPYTTHQLSLIIPYYKNKHKVPESHVGSFGISLYTDQAGEGKNFKTTGGNVSYAYDLRLNESQTFSFAMQAGFIQKAIDKNKLQWGEQYNRFIGFDNTIIPVDLNQIQNRTFLDLTMGAFWRYYATNEKSKLYSLYAGIVASHFNNPDESVLNGVESTLPTLFKLHYGMVYTINQKTFISANMISLMQNKEYQHNFGTFLSYMLPFETKGKLTNLIGRVGTWYRFGDAFITSAELLTDNFQIGFSYDWNEKSLRYNNRGTGSYEITMGYRFHNPAPPKVRY